MAAHGSPAFGRIEPRWIFTDVRHAAIAFRRELQRRLPDQVTTSWRTEQRGECVFFDYNQIARDEAAGRLPLLGGVQDTSTRKVVDKIVRLRQLGSLFNEACVNLRSAWIALP